MKSKQFTMQVSDVKVSGDSKTAFIILQTQIIDNFKYTAGQYVVIHWNGEEKYMTLASAPSESHLLFAMKSSDSPFKRSISNLKPGDTITVSEPAGVMNLELLQAEHQHVFIAGGIGVTPFRSMLLEAQLQNLHLYATLLYSFSFAESAPFHTEFADLASKIKNFTYVPIETRSDISRRITEHHITDSVLDYHAAQYHIVGSHGFISSVSSMLLNRLKVARPQIHAEVFCGYCPDHVCCCDHVRMS